jgi:peptidoglycan/xylan/chitin deacetylase (PgdA/CDA1 family)
MSRSRDRLRWSMKMALATAIARACVLPVVGDLARARRKPLILGYHRVVEDFAGAARTEMPSMLISLSMFERHLEWLGRRFRFVSLDEIGHHAAHRIPFDDPVAAITFDDGYSDVYEYAFPTLRRKGIPAAVFVVTDLVGQDVWQIHDKLYYLLQSAFARWTEPRAELFRMLSELGIPPADVFPTHSSTRNPVFAVAALLPTLSQSDITRIMAWLESQVGVGQCAIPRSVTWPMLTEMRRAGFTIGSHTKTHVSLPCETRDAVAAELTGSKRALEQRLGEPVVHFAYPGGQFTPEVVETVTKSGYQFGYTACPHGDPKHPAATLERLLLWEGSSIDATGRFHAPIFNCQVHDLWPPSRRCERVHTA